MVGMKEKQSGAFDALKDAFGYTNMHQAPRLEKVVVSTGVGSLKDKNKIEVVRDRLAKITGQHTAPRTAKKSIAAFKTREGDTVGYQVTLRGARMFDFIDRLVHIALPRMRDFRGLSPSSLDAMGNYTVGIREHAIFPETSDEDLRDMFGLSVSVVTSARTREEAFAFLRHLGFPLKER